MFRRARLLSASQTSPAVLLAAATFTLGPGVGATIGPVTASRNGDDTPVLATAAPTATVPLRSPESVISHMVHSAEVLRVLDGDTFEARVNLWPGLYTTTRVRLRGIDAPELKAHCVEERAAAEAARDALQTILAQGEPGITRVTFDKYGGRVVANASTKTTPDVSDALLSAGLVRAYSGGRRNGWCP